MRASTFMLRFAALLVTTSLLMAEDGPLDPAYHKAHDQLALLEQQLESLRTHAAADLIGKESYRYPNGVVPNDQAYLDSGIDPALGAIRMLRRDLNRRRSAWDRAETTLDAFHNSTYNEIGTAVSGSWKAHINVALVYI